MNCEFCGHPVRNPKKMVYQGQIVIACWDCFRREMREKNKTRHDLTQVEFKTFLEAR